MDELTTKAITSAPILEGLGENVRSPLTIESNLARILMTRLGLSHEAFRISHLLYPSDGASPFKLCWRVIITDNEAMCEAVLAIMRGAVALAGLQDVEVIRIELDIRGIISRIEVQVTGPTIPDARVAFQRMLTLTEAAGDLFD